MPMRERTIEYENYTIINIVLSPNKRLITLCGLSTATLYFYPQHIHLSAD
jgi:hypothetical protein